MTDYKEVNCVSNINTTRHGGIQLKPKESQQYRRNRISKKSYNNLNKINLAYINSPNPITKAKSYKE
jgi:hypothetical protein